MSSACLHGKAKTKTKQHTHTHNQYAFLILQDKGLNFPGCSYRFLLLLINFAIDSFTTCIWWTLAILVYHSCLLLFSISLSPLIILFPTQFVLKFTSICFILWTTIFNGAICMVMGLWLSLLGLISLPHNEQQHGGHCFPTRVELTVSTCCLTVGSSQLDVEWKGKAKLRVLTIKANRSRRENAFLQLEAWSWLHKHWASKKCSRESSEGKGKTQRELCICTTKPEGGNSKLSMNARVVPCSQ